MKRLLSSAAATLAAAAIISSSASAADTRFQIDCNNDKCFNTADITAMSDFLLNNGSEANDITGDGVVNVFDLVALRQYAGKYNDKMPSGLWYSGTSKEDMVFFWFNNANGSVTTAQNGNRITLLTSELKDGVLRSTADTGETSASNLMWIDDTHIDLYIDVEDTVRHLVYCGDQQDNNEDDLSGSYFTSGAYGERYFNIDGQCGNFRHYQNPQFADYCYTINGDTITFCCADGTVKKAGFKRTDRDHFSVTWDDGVTEKFTRRQFTKENGLTYVNGILIANKSYPLPSDYGPGELTAETQLAFNEMKNAAAGDGVMLWVCSGFRSYATQSSLYNGYVARDGKAAADTYSARPGYSEHQTGLAADLNYADNRILSTPAAKWIEENCWKYGFILRYPKGKENKTGYNYEPWHVRYLGKEDAKLVHDSGLCLEEYLGIDSVYR